MNYKNKESRGDIFTNGPQNLTCINQTAERSQSQDIFKEANHFYRRDTIEKLFPGGKWEDKEYCILSPLRPDKHVGSFSICEDGLYYDFANNDCGDLIDLVSRNRNVDKAEAARIIIEISGGIIEEAPALHGYDYTKTDKKAEAVIPIPEDIIKSFNPVGADNHWIYRDIHGMAWCATTRYNQPDGSKKVIPYYFNGQNWEKGNPLPSNRPLFNSDKLLNNNSPVLIVEGEKCSSIKVNGFITVTWIGGSNAVEKSDFSVLKKRRVLIWPDADIAGFDAAKKIKRLLPHAEILRIEDKPQGWDIADAVTEGINPLTFIEETLLASQDQLHIIKNQTKDKEKKPGRPSKSKQAMELLKDYRLCRFKDKRYMIRENEAIIIGSRAYREFVRGEFYRSTGDALASHQMEEIINIHRAYAGESAIQEVFTRIASPSDKITYIDLNDSNNTIIEVDASGWRVSDNPPVIFLRPLNMEALPMPEINGSIEHLKNFFNLEREEDFPVIVAALVYILRGRPSNRGSYPIIVATGIEGSAKTTFMKIIKKLIDPGTPETRTPPSETRDLFIAASHGLLLSLDNISTISREMSDALCSLTTGGGFARKMNYTDDEEQIFDLCRPILLNGISFEKAPDLLSRSIIIDLKPIRQEDRKTEAEIWAEFDLYRASIFGALLSILSRTLREEALMINERFNLPRLADFGKFSIALERGNCWEIGKIAQSLKSSYEAALAETAEGNPLIPVIISIVEEHGSWRGTATELLKAVNNRSDDTDKRLSLWPKTPAKLGTILRREHNVLASKGVSIKQSRVATIRFLELFSKHDNTAAVSEDIPDFDDLPIIDTL